MIRLYDAMINASDEDADAVFIATLKSEKQKLWAQIDDFSGQLVDVEQILNDMRFEEFSLFNRFAREDE